MVAEQRYRYAPGGKSPWMRCCTKATRAGPECLPNPAHESGPSDGMGVDPMVQGQNPQEKWKWHSSPMLAIGKLSSESQVGHGIGWKGGTRCVQFP